MKNITVIGLLTRLGSGMDPRQIDSWKTFYTRNIKQHLPQRLADDVYCLYTHYAGDHTQPMDMLIGFPMPHGTPAPSSGGVADLVAVDIPDIHFKRYLSEGKLPDTLVETWQHIWDTCTNRAFVVDIDYYPACSDTCVETYVSIRTEDTPS